MRPTGKDSGINLIERPRITVASVISKGNKFLLVQEKSAEKIVFNQPAGHLEGGETLIAAAQREALEETAWCVKVSHLLGISQYLAKNGISYVRVSFVAEPISFDPQFHRDSDIIDICWKTYDEVKAINSHLRSPLVMNDIEKFLRGEFFDLELVQGFVAENLY